MPIKIESNVRLGTVNGKELFGDLYLPETPPTAPGPAVVLVFGGGWSTGDRTQQKGYGITLAKAGFVCLAPDYRLSGEAKWPAPLNDIRRALQWLRANAATYQVDPNRIAISGNSSGGHLALMTLAPETALGSHADVYDPPLNKVSGHVAAVCTFYPPTDLKTLCGLADGKASIEGLMGPNPTEQQLDAASPLTHVRAGWPPALLMSGNADTRVPCDQTLRLYDRLVETGNVAELHVFAKQPHAFDMDREMFAVASANMIAFFKRYV